MNTIEMDRALRKLRLSGMAATLDTRILEAQTSNVPPLVFVRTRLWDPMPRTSVSRMFATTRAAMGLEHVMWPRPALIAAPARPAMGAGFASRI